MDPEDIENLQDLLNVYHRALRGEIQFEDEDEELLLVDEEEEVRIVDEEEEERIVDEEEEERIVDEEAVQHAHHFDEYPDPNVAVAVVEFEDNPNPNPNEQVQGGHFDDGNPNEEGEIQAQENEELNPNEEEAHGDMIFINDQNNPNVIFAMQHPHVLRRLRGVDIYELDPNMIAALQNPMEAREEYPGVTLTFKYLDQMINNSNALIIMVTNKPRQVEIVVKRRRYDEDARRIVRIIKPNSLNIVRMRLLETTRREFDAAEYNVKVVVINVIPDGVLENNRVRIDTNKLFYLGPACVGFDRRLTVFLPQKLQILCANDAIRHDLQGISVDDFRNFIFVCIGRISPKDLPLPEALAVLKLYRRYADDMTEMHQGELRRYDYNYFPNLAMRDFGRIHTTFPQNPLLVRINPNTINFTCDILQPFQHVIRDNAHIALYHGGSGFMSFALWVDEHYTERPFEMPLTVKVTIEINGVKLKKQPTISRKLRNNYRSMGCPNLFSLSGLANRNHVELTVEIRYEHKERAFNRSVEKDFTEMRELGFFTNPNAMPENRLNSPETRKLLDILIHGTIQMDNAEFRLILELAQLIGCERAKEYCCRAFTTANRIVANRDDLGDLFQQLHNLPDELNNQDYIRDHVRACELAVQHATVDLYADHMYYDWTQPDLDFAWQGHHV